MDGLPLALAHRMVLIALMDALPVTEKLLLEQRLLALVTGKAPIPGVVPRTPMSTEVRAEIDSLIRALERSAIASLAE